MGWGWDDPIAKSKERAIALRKESELSPVHENAPAEGRAPASRRPSKTVSGLETAMLAATRVPGRQPRAQKIARLELAAALVPCWAGTQERKQARPRAAVHWKEARGADQSEPWAT